MALFISHSMADSYWPELHRLLGTENTNQSKRQKAVLENPHIVNSFFIKKLEAWNKMFFEEIFETEWIWLRYENQGRGTIHAHMMVRLTNALDLIGDCQKVRVGRHTVEVLKDSKLTDAEQKQLQEKVKEGEEAEGRVIKFCDALITTMNPLSEAERNAFKPGIGLKHPCAKKGTSIAQSDLEEDYTDLINCIQCHENCTGYCLRDKNGKKTCKFGCPGSFVQPQPLSSNNTKMILIQCF